MHFIRWYALILLLGAPLSAQWTIKSRTLKEATQDGHVSLNVSFPVLVGDSAPEIRKAINKALGQASQVDELRKEALEAKRIHAAQTKQAGSDPGEEDNPYEVTVSFERGVTDAQWLSLCIQYSGQTNGAAQGYQSWTGCTYDVRTGKALAWLDLFKEGWERPFRSLLKKQLSTLAEELTPGWEEHLDQAEKGFFLKPMALVVYFSKYALAPGASSVVSVEIPRARLRELARPGGPLGQLIPAAPLRERP